MITVTIDGRQVEVPEGTLLVEAARAAGVHVPVYCYHPKLKPVGACRVCLVQVEKMPRPVTACTTPAADGMVVRTDAPAAREGRRSVLEFLLINHPLDCPVCDKGGECDLQDFTLRYGPGASRFVEAKIRRRKAVALGPLLVLDEERCILCQRCVRYEDEVLGERNLVLGERGGQMVIGPLTDDGYRGHFSGNNVELCPVGALTARPYRFKARPWDLQSAPVVCGHCSLGCPMRADVRHGDVMRLVSRDDPEVNGGWLCDRGRYGFGFTRSPERLTRPLVRRGGELIPVTWETAIAEAARGLAAATSRGCLGGGRLTDEEARIFQQLARVALRTEAVDWRTGRQMLASPEVLGLPGAGPADVDGADLFVLVDTCPAEEAPVLDLRIRRAVREAKAAVVDVGPVAGAVAVAAERVPCLPEELPRRLMDLLARVRSARRPVVVWNGRGGPDVADAVRALGAPTVVLGEFPNARGAEAAGCVPGEGAPDAAAMLGGAVDALYVAGANPAVTWPDGPAARRVLAGLRFLVVQDLFLTETARLAHVVLPAAGWLEKDGTYTNLFGLRQRTRAVVKAPGEALPDREIFLRLARALGAILGAGDPEARPVRYAPPSVAPEPSAGDGAGAPGSLRLVLRPRLLAGAGTLRFDPVLAGVGGPAEVRVHPQDAPEEGMVRVAPMDAPDDRGRAVEARLIPDARVAPGVAVLGDRIPGANALGARVVLRPADAVPTGAGLAAGGVGS
jgi:NADH-quinone oxidoreductase subunit G